MKSSRYWTSLPVAHLQFHALVHSTCTDVWVSKQGIFLDHLCLDKVNCIQHVPFCCSPHKTTNGLLPESKIHKRDIVRDQYAAKPLPLKHWMFHHGALNMSRWTARAFDCLNWRAVEHSVVRLPLAVAVALDSGGCRCKSGNCISSIACIPHHIACIVRSFHCP